MQRRGFVAGIDLGGTKVRIALVDLSGEMLLAETWPTPGEEGPNAVIDQIAQGVKTLIGRADLPTRNLTAAGIGAPGPLNTKTGVVATMPNLPGWEDYPLRDRLSTALGAPVALGNDANAAALGEHRFGAGRGVRDMVMVTLGTGVGGGVISGGRLLEGQVGAGGEIGHMIVSVGGLQCGCGRFGCLEAYAGGRAMALHAERLLSEGGPATTRLALLAGGQSPDMRVVEQAAREGDQLSLTILAEATRHLTAGLVNVVHLFNPELVLFGGGLLALRDLFIEPAIAEARELVFPLHGQGLRFGYVQLGDDMGALGAAALALDLLSATEH